MEWEVGAAGFRKRVSQSDTVDPTYLHAALSANGDKHEPFADLNAGTIVVRGAGGSTTSLHPQSYGVHWIEVIYARDQHDRVVTYSAMPADSTEPSEPRVSMSLDAMSPAVR